MKIYTRVVVDCATGVIEDADSFDYDGPLTSLKSSPSAPAPPDYVGAATAQGAANEATARVQGRLNNPNITNPFGTQSVKFGTDPVFDESGYNAALQKWQNTPDTPTTSRVVTGYDDENKPIYSDIPTGQGRGDMPTKDQFTNVADKDQVSLTQTLNPEQQALLDQQIRISQQVGDIGESGLNRVSQSFGTPLDVSGSQSLQDKAEKAIFSRLDPIWSQRQAQTETQLRNQGLVPGGEAYDNAMRDFNYGRNDAYQQGILGAIQTAPQALQQEIAIRNQPLSELNALRTGSQPTVPQFQQYQGGNINAPPLFQGAQAQGQADMGLYNAQVGQANSFNSGLATIAGGALAFF